jgi:hypothetical protein
MSIPYARGFIMAFLKFAPEKIKYLEEWNQIDNIEDDEKRHPKILEFYRKLDFGLASGIKIN